MLKGDALLPTESIWSELTLDDGKTNAFYLREADEDRCDRSPTNTVNEVEWNGMRLIGVSTRSLISLNRWKASRENLL